MIKSPMLDLRYFQTSVKNSLKSKWCILLILFPLSFFGVYLVAKEELVDWVVKLFPRDEEKSIGFFSDFVSLVFTEMLWLTGFLVLSWIFAVHLPITKIIHALDNRLMLHKRLFVSTVILFTFCISVFTAFKTLEAFPNSSDEYAYLFQAETMSKGRLWEKAHPLPEFFYFNHIAQMNEIRIGRFPPGWPMILSSAYFLDISPFLINPILGLIGLIVFYLFVRDVYNERVAVWSLLVMALTSFYIFNAASLFSHSSCMVATILFVYGIYLHNKKQTWLPLVMSGFALGVMITIRYYTAVIVFIPFFFYLIYHHHWKVIRVFILIGIGMLPCLAGLLWYQYVVTGNPLLPVTMWAYDDEALGFVRGHTFIKGVEHIIRWSFMFLYWSSPGLFILFIIYLVKKIRRKETRITHPEDYIFPLLIIGYFFYYQIGGNQYGPRFFFEALPFLTVFVASNVIQQRERWALALLLAGSIYTIAKFPMISARENKVIEERNDVYRQVAEKGLNNALVFISTPTSIIRPMPVGDLTRNNVKFNDNVLYAQDLEEKNQLLMEFYPDRIYYRYERDPESRNGELIKIERSLSQE